MCTETDQLTAYLDGELEADARARFDAHLPSCATCPGELALLRRTLPTLVALPRPVPTANLRRQVLLGISASRPSLWERLSLRWSVPLGTLAAAAAVGGLVLVGGGRQAPLIPIPGEELALAENLELMQNFGAVASADLSDEDLEVVAHLDQLESGRGRR